MPESHNKRRKPRIQAALSLTAKQAKRVMFEAQIANISESGAFLQTQQLLRPGDVVMLFLNLNIGQEVKSCMLQGKVAWFNAHPHKGPVGCGVAFEDVAPAMGRLLQTYIQQHVNDPEALIGEITVESSIS